MAHRTAQGVEMEGGGERQEKDEGDLSEVSQVCTMSALTGDLPWPCSVKLLPERDGLEDESQHVDMAEEGSPRLLQANFAYKGVRKRLQWKGPQGGASLLHIISRSFGIPLRSATNPKGKLVYLIDTKTNEVVDIDLPLNDGASYTVRVEPEDSSPFNIVPCLVAFCTSRYDPSRIQLQE
mmetsp:Transcript_7496/g.17044  ORF Transcript_7496/g.17044 Transcript_7496/m.17044 type:complete len:180 (-) Transcript_7496:142-681(-)